MEVRKEYEQTEIGVIPGDWIGRQLSTISAFITKGSTPTTYGYKWESDGILFLRSECVTNNGLDLIQSMFISEVAHKTLVRSEIKQDDILMTITGNVGRVIYLSNFIGKGNINQHIARIRITEDDLDNIYIYHFISQNNYRKYFESIVTGQAYPQISLRQVREAKIYFPPTKSEQTAIATALSDADSLISSLEKLIAKKRSIKQGAMQELLRPKEGWETKTLGEIGECVIGLTYRPDNVRESGLLVMRSSNIQNNALSFENNVFVDVEVSEKLTLKENDILICVRNGSRDLIGKCALIKDQAIGETFGAFMSVFRSPNNEFVFNLFQSNIIKRQIDVYLGATINQITNKSLNSFEIPFPPIEEQTVISNILNHMDNEITVLEQKLFKYKRLKQGMMQELLTGKIRLI